MPWGVKPDEKDLLESDGKIREEILRVKEQGPNKILATTPGLRTVP